jgi:tetratricopeptide (TPR) repeat protein
VGEVTTDVETSHKRLIIIALPVLILSSLGTAFPQRRRAPEDQIKLGEQFYAADEECQSLLKQQRWKEAETACTTAVRLADRFADYRELEKMGAYENVGDALMGEGRYKEAITYYTRAVEMGRPRVTDKNAETGQVYASIGAAYHRLRDLDKAREFYRKAESTYRVAYSNINPEAEYGVEMRQSYVRRLKVILENHQFAAEQAGAAAEAEEIKKQIAGLPK